ncbi:4Fe-4S binding protein [Methanobacterium movens]
MAIGLKTYRDICHGCGNCVIACPVNALRSDEVAAGKGPSELEDLMGLIMIVEDGAVQLKNADLCGKCGTCVKSCPVEAIKLEEF